MKMGIAVVKRLNEAILQQLISVSYIEGNLQAAGDGL